MRLRPLATALLAATFAVGSVAAAEPAPGTPEATVAVPVQALRNNDLLKLFKAMPEADQAKAREEWQQKGATATPEEKAEFDEKFALLLAPNAVDTLMAMAEPQLKQMNPQEMAGGVQLIGGMLAMQLAQGGKNKELSQTLQTFVGDLAGWLPESGIEDPAKLRKALTAITGAAKALGAKNSDELIALPLEEFLKRLGGATKEFKKAFSAYGVDVDTFLDSVAIADVQGTGDKRTGKLSMTLFGKPYSFPVNLVQKNGTWQFDTEELQKSVAPMMGMGGGAEPSEM